MMLAGQIDKICWFELRQNAARWAGEAQRSATHGLLGARIEPIAHPTGTDIRPELSSIELRLSKRAWQSPCKRERARPMSWIRRRLRCIQLKQWKKPKRLHRRLKQPGYKPPFSYIKMKSWRNAASPLASFAMPNRWFHEELRLVDMARTDVGISVSVI